MKALTSIAPNPLRVEDQRRFLASWLRAGLEPVSLNHPSEIPWLAHIYTDVKFVATENTARPQFGKDYVCINAFFEYIRKLDAPALLINADLEMKASTEQLDRLESFAGMSMPYLLQYNCTSPGVQVLGMIEPCGISAFVAHPRHVDLYLPTFMSMGQPWWDYWVPVMAARGGDTFVTPSAPIVCHYAHPSGWSQANWITCAVELGRLLGNPIEPVLADASALSAQVYDEIRKLTTEVEL